MPTKYSPVFKKTYHYDDSGNFVNMEDGDTTGGVPLTQPTMRKEITPEGTIDNFARDILTNTASSAAALIPVSKGGKFVTSLLTDLVAQKVSGTKETTPAMLGNATLDAAISTLVPHLMENKVAIKFPAKATISGSPWHHLVTLIKPEIKSTPRVVGKTIRGARVPAGAIISMGGKTYKGGQVLPTHKVMVPVKYPAWKKGLASLLANLGIDILQE